MKTENIVIIFFLILFLFTVLSYLYYIIIKNKYENFLYDNSDNPTNSKRPNAPNHSNKYEYIFVIISSKYKKKEKDDTRNTDVYEQLKRISRTYNEKMSKVYNYKYFYVEYNEDITEDVVEKDDCIYVKGEEKFEKIYEKTVKSIEYINQKYNYNHLIRTNISSFWNIHNLFEKQHFPSVNCYAGIYISYQNLFHFISGTAIVLSRDVSEYLVDHFTIDYDMPDDVLIGKQLKEQYIMNRLTDDSVYWVTNDKEIQNIPINVTNILYFRVRNVERVKDIEVFKLLNNRIYEIND